MTESHSAELAAAVEDLSTEVKDLKRKIEVNRTWRNVLTGLIVVKAITIIILVYTVVQLSHTQHDQQVTRQQVLCPLYSLFVQSVDAPRQPGETPTAYEQRQAARTQIHNSYTQLGR